MSAKRKLFVSLFSIVFVVFAVITTFAAVYGLTEQDVVSMIDIGYTAEDIDGYVEATYTVGNVENYLTPVGKSVDENKLVFNAEDTENAGSLEFPNELITLTEENDTLTIKYLYSNTGDKHYIASMDFESVINNTNMIVKYGIKNSQTGVIDYSTDRYAVVVPAHSTNKEYYIQISIDDKAYQASFSASMDWLLQGCDPQSEEYLSYESLDIQGSDGVYTASYTGGYIHSGELIYPSEINGSPVTAVSSSSTITNEQKSYIKSVTIPDSVTTIDNNAFNGYTHLEEVVFGYVAEVSAQSSTSNLTTIGEYAFANCVRLENLTLPSGVTSVGKNVFENCYNLKQFTIPNGVTTLTDAMFKNCSSLNSVEITENIVDFPEEIFSGCSELVGFVIPEKIETIGAGAFKDCKRLVGEVDLSFATNVGESAFEGCSGLTKITIGENITSLGKLTFANCENVEEFYLLSHEAITTLSDINVFNNIDEDCKIYITENLKDAYSNNVNWATYVDHFDEIGFTTTGECVDSVEAPVLGMRIYGNSIQNGTPTPDTPVEIESVGDKTVNLLDVFGRSLGTLSGVANTTIREFEFNKYYVGLTMNNYYVPSYVTSYSFSDDSIIINANQSGYGLAFPLKIKPNTIYTISKDITSSHVGVSFYTSNGEYLSSVSTLTFTTPENCEILTVILRPNPLNEDVAYTEIQLEEGSVATEYEPYGKYKVPVKVNGIVTNIYLDEPLRKVGNVADYIDIKNKKIVRCVEVVDNTSTQTLENSYRTKTPTEETIQLPEFEFETINGTTTFEVLTSVQPSQIMVKYHK